MLFKKILMIVILIFISNYFYGCSGCSSNKKKEGSGSEALETRLAAALEFENGEVEEGIKPEPDNSEDKPQIISVDSLNKKIMCGQGFLIDIKATYSADDIKYAIVAIKKYEDSYFKVDVSSIQIAENIYSLFLYAKLEVDESLFGKDFQLEISIVTTNNIVSEYFNYSLHLESEECVSEGDELCDGIDNNCDGYVDETFDKLYTECREGVGVCSVPGIYKCGADKLEVTCVVDNNYKNEKVNQPCNDGKYCTVDEYCSELLECIGGKARLDCARLDDECNIGICSDEDEDCIKKPRAEGEGTCSLDLYCMTNELCEAGECVGTPRVCSDCYICDNGEAACIIDNTKNGESCNSDISPDMKCNLEGECVLWECDQLYETKCSEDGESILKCQVAEGTQKWKVDENCSDYTSMCGDGYCDEESISCKARPKQDDLPCEDDNPCTIQDKCNEGLCIGTQRDCEGHSNVDVCYEAACIVIEESYNCVNGEFKTVGTECGPDNRFCMEGHCDKHECSIPDEKKCSDDKSDILICNKHYDNKYYLDILEACVVTEPLCNNVECIDENSEVKCNVTKFDDNTLCGEEGDTETICLNGFCSRHDCAENQMGTKKCGSDSTVQTCGLDENGFRKWITTKDCPLEYKVCNAETLDCIECLNSTDCNNNPSGNVCNAENVCICGDSGSACSEEKSVCMDGYPSPVCVECIESSNCSDFKGCDSITYECVDFFENINLFDTFNTGALLNQLLIKDLNNDSKNDVITLDKINNIISVYTNDFNDQLFTNSEEIYYPANGDTVKMILNDFSGEGKQDFIILSNLVGVIISDNSESNFSEYTYESSSTSSFIDITAGKFENDSKTDFAVIKSDCIKIFTNDGSGGSFTITDCLSSAVLDNPEYTLEKIANIDLDNNGIDEIALLYSSDNNGAISNYLTIISKVNGEIKYETAERTLLSTDKIMDIIITNIDGNTYNDVVIADQKNITICTNSGEHLDSPGIWGLTCEKSITPPIDGINSIVELNADNYGTNSASGVNKSDLAVIYNNSSEVSILLNYCGGAVCNFDTTGAYIVPNGTIGIASMDLDNDVFNSDDLLILSNSLMEPGNNSIAYLKNRANGTFNAPKLFYKLEGEGFVSDGRIGDLQGFDKNNIVTDYYSASDFMKFNVVQMPLTTPDRSSDLLVGKPLWSRSLSPKSSQSSMDTLMVALVEKDSEKKIHSCIMNMSMEFICNSITVDSAADYFVIDDLDQDTNKDLIIKTNSGFVVFKSDGAGVFSDSVNYNFTDFEVLAIGTGLINNDIYTDIILAAKSNTNSSTSLFVLINEEGKFPNTLDESLIFDIGTEVSISSIISSDFNNDTYKDILLSLNTDNEIRAYYNNKIGGIDTDSIKIFNTEDSGCKGPTVFALGNLDEDTDNDIAVACTDSNSVLLFQQSSSELLMFPISYYTGSTPESLYFADYQDEGDNDVYVGNYKGKSVSIIVNNMIDNGRAVEDH